MLYDIWIDALCMGMGMEQSKQATTKMNMTHAFGTRPLHQIDIYYCCNNMPAIIGFPNLKEAEETLGCSHSHFRDKIHQLWVSTVWPYS